MKKLSTLGLAAIIGCAGKADIEPSAKPNVPDDGTIKTYSFPMEQSPTVDDQPQVVSRETKSLLMSCIYNKKGNKGLDITAMNCGPETRTAEECHTTKISNLRVENRAIPACAEHYRIFNENFAEVIGNKKPVSAEKNLAESQAETECYEAIKKIQPGEIARAEYCYAPAIRCIVGHIRSIGLNECLPPELQK